jgi:hypothetical protein
MKAHGLMVCFLILIGRPLSAAIICVSSVSELQNCVRKAMPGDGQLSTLHKKTAMRIEPVVFDLAGATLVDNSDVHRLLQQTLAKYETLLSIFAIDEQIRRVPTKETA